MPPLPPLREGAAAERGGCDGPAFQAFAAGDGLA